MFPLIFFTLDSEADKNKIVQLYEKYHRLMFYVARKVLSDHALAEDAVSESIEKMIYNIHKIDDISCYKTKAFIVIIVRNTALNILKKKGRTDTHLDVDSEVIADESFLVSDKIISIESYNNIVSIINSLPDTLRDVAVLSLVHEQSHSEIAEILEISYDTVKMRLSRAKKTIRTKLGKI
ncbi:MAG: RNA polymerase sigma factor [Defluviitaleaceae bacterium]|nr:RNA polymerase sigma factor [Defluviitaleaceae bacterium]